MGAIPKHLLHRKTLLDIVRTCGRNSAVKQLWQKIASNTGVRKPAFRLDFWGEGGLYLDLGLASKITPMPSSF